MKEKMMIDFEKLKKLKESYTKAIQTNSEWFVFDGKKIVTKFAKYLIQYIESKAESQNTGIVTQGFSKKRRTKWQEDNKTTLILPKDLVKIRLKGITEDGGEVVENLWVKVTEIQPNGNITGRIDNKPVAMTNFKLGDTVRFKRAEIQELFGE